MLNLYNFRQNHSSNVTIFVETAKVLLTIRQCLIESTKTVHVRRVTQKIDRKYSDLRRNYLYGYNYITQINKNEKTAIIEAFVVVYALSWITN